MKDFTFTVLEKGRALKLLRSKYRYAPDKNVERWTEERYLGLT